MQAKVAVRIMRLFERGPDRYALIEVPIEQLRAEQPVELVGNLLAADAGAERLLISFLDMMTEHGVERPTWVPCALVAGGLHEIVDPETGESLPPRVPHFIPVKTPDGQIFETDSARFGWGTFALPNWLTAVLDQLTGPALRERRIERQIEEEKRREAAASLLRQEQALEALRKKQARKTDAPASKNLFGR